MVAHGALEGIFAEGRFQERQKRVRLTKQTALLAPLRGFWVTFGPQWISEGGPKITFFVIMLDKTRKGCPGAAPKKT